MADPFDDIDGIVQAKETEVSVGESALFKKDTAQAPKPDEGEAYLEQFPKRIRNKANSDLELRLEMEKAIHAAMVELHDIRERMYVVRFDDVRSTEEIKRDLQNYMSEVERLESKVNKLREKMLESFVKSLNLEQVGVSGTMITTTLHHKNSGMPKQGGGDQTRLFSEGSLAPRFGVGQNRTRSPAPPGAGEQEEDLLRKYSFGLLGVKSPATQTRSPSPNVTDLYNMGSGGRKMSQGEITDARAMLYNLKQKKELTPQEEDLVEILTTKLRSNVDA
mmetsp:Transcript_28568/g.44234  ORF Transcript_28568/g.44234 Transcript_28568/m.44234 type:complete len:277 (-) Transcript_28568:162-992(-)|eukprot:CAMPEP_0201522588 /NCGR_PEP_ID=MMETSP0161_2-20130828/18276_1 /ASSEMBLY_ACC=CAM_ASM_000251 /TAXON_ID=180227 /ORGANISM="Neoparamoeba aestuarina, Strain SoJaBio B1-5/56/2" /LENGTH=276 /DNA_ID=CAMNT_0047921485 /DNA_START=102 /DNA_END=932 /DNA_ORIENTATION=-